MSRIRIAMIGWDHYRPAASADDVNVGFGLPWVEIDGVRVRSIRSATVEAVAYGERPDGTTDVSPLVSPRLTLDILGPVEIVYVDEGTLEPLPATEKVLIEPQALPPVIDSRTAIPKPTGP